MSYRQEAFDKGAGGVNGSQRADTESQCARARFRQDYSALEDATLKLHRYRKFGVAQIHLADYPSALDVNLSYR